MLIKKGETNWKYILVIIILALIVSGGILIYQYWWLPKEEKLLEIVTPKKEILEIPADWKTYRKERCKLEFKYPPEASPEILDYLNPDELAKKGIPYNPDTEILCAGFINIQSIVFYLSVTKTEFEDIESWFKDYQKIEEKPYRYEGVELTQPQIVLVEDIMIGNIRGKKTITKGLAFYNGGRISVIKDGYLYDFTAWKREEEFNQEEIELVNQIFSTFRFLE